MRSIEDAIAAKQAQINFLQLEIQSLEEALGILCQTSPAKPNGKAEPPPQSKAKAAPQPQPKPKPKANGFDYDHCARGGINRSKFPAVGKYAGMRLSDAVLDYMTTTKSGVAELGDVAQAIWGVKLIKGSPRYLAAYNAIYRAEGVTLDNGIVRIAQ